MKSNPAEIDFGALFERCASELERGAESNTSLQLVCELLHGEVPHYDWFGFYLAVPEEKVLVLGPFEGAPTDHVRIPYGRGICGQAASNLETFLVDDVGKSDNYLACSVDVKSEIVVPIFANDRFIGEIDIDSHTVGAFADADREFLERLAPLVAPYVPRVPAP